MMPRLNAPGPGINPLTREAKHLEVSRLVEKFLAGVAFAVDPQLPDRRFHQPLRQKGSWLSR